MNKKEGILGFCFILLASSFFIFYRLGTTKGKLQQDILHSQNNKSLEVPKDKELKIDIKLQEPTAELS